MPICSVTDAMATVSTDPYHEENTLFAVSLDATLAALHDVGGNVTLFELAHGHVIWSVPVGTEPYALHIADDYGVIAVSRSGEVSRLARSTGIVEARASFGREIEHEDLTCLVPETRCLLAGAGTALLCYDLKSGEISELQSFEGAVIGFSYCAPGAKA
jgi:hypothetical protein